MLLTFTSGAIAEEKKTLYKWIDKQGNVHYSDEPQKGAQEIEMKQVPTTRIEQPVFQEVDALVPGNATPSSEAINDNFYQTIELTEPLNNGVVRNNAGEVTLKATLQPNLDKEHSIRFFVDGRPVNGESKSLSLVVKDIEYGPHSAGFIVVDAKGKQIQASDIVQFQLMHIINPRIRQERNGN